MLSSSIVYLESCLAINSLFEQHPASYSHSYTHSHIGGTWYNRIVTLLSTHQLGVCCLEVNNWTCFITQCVVELVTQGSTVPSKAPSHPCLLSALITLMFLHILHCASFTQLCLINMVGVNPTMTYQVKFICVGSHSEVW